METINYTNGPEAADLDIPGHFNTVLEVVNDRPGWFLRYGLIAILAFMVLFGVIFYPWLRSSAEYSFLASVRPGSPPSYYEGRFSMPLAEARKHHIGDRLRVDSREYTGEEAYSEGQITAISALVAADRTVEIAFRFPMTTGQSSPFYFEQASMTVLVRE